MQFKSAYLMNNCMTLIFKLLDKFTITNAFYKTGPRLKFAT